MDGSYVHIIIMYHVHARSADLDYKYKNYVSSVMQGQNQYLEISKTRKYLRGLLTTFISNYINFTCIYIKYYTQKTIQRSNFN